MKKRQRGRRNIPLRTRRFVWAGIKKVSLWWSWLAAGRSSARMLTESRLVQWPHLTVTVLKRLLQGTLTCSPESGEV